MTDEEMAKEYVDKLYAEKVSKEDYDKDGRILYRSEDISDAYLAGQKAGRPKWHKVADGDLPNGYRVVLNQAGMATQYDPNRGFLGFGGAGIIAWCEITQYTEE